MLRQIVYAIVKIASSITPGSYIVPKEPDKEYLAYCCLTPVENLTLRRSKYLLTNQDVPYPTSYASNEFIEEAAAFPSMQG